MNDYICYIFFEDFYQIKYLQSSTMMIFLFIFHSLLSYFMNLIMITFFLMNTLLSRKINFFFFLKEEQNNKRHMSSKFLLDKIISLEDLNLINQCSLGNKQNTIYHHSNFPSMTTNLPHKIQYTQRNFWDIKIQQEYIRHCTMEYFRNYKILLGFN